MMNRRHSLNLLVRSSGPLLVRMVGVCHPVRHLHQFRGAWRPRLPGCVLSLLDDGADLRKLAQARARFLGGTLFTLKPHTHTQRPPIFRHILTNLLWGLGDKKPLCLTLDVSTPRKKVGLRSTLFKQGRRYGSSHL